MRFVIWSPPYRHHSGGIRALHILCHELRSRGHDASIQPFLGEWASSPHDAPRATRRVGAVHVYPEIIRDTPIESERYVRWILQDAELDGECFGWMPGMAPRVLQVPIIDTSVFHPRPGPRSGVAFWVGKGVADASVLPDGAVQITNAWPESPDALADYLRTLDHLVSFDPYTSLVHEATLCGTPVRVYTSALWPPERCRTGFLAGYGVAYAEDEITWARESAHAAADEYAGASVAMLKTVDAFAERVRDVFG